MPRWGVHLAIANKILEQKNDIDENFFLFGNILPDLQDGYLIKDISNIVDHRKNHYDLFNGKPVYQNFYDIYVRELNKPVILGYFTHLIADYCFNNKFEERYVLDNKNNFIGYINNKRELIKKSKEEALKDKNLDFKAFESYIFNTYKINIPYFNENLVIQCNEIKNINIIEKDIKKAIHFIKECQEEAKMDNSKCSIFKIEELENEIQNVTEIACNLIDKIHD